MNIIGTLEIGQVIGGGGEMVTMVVTQVENKRVRVIRCRPDYLPTEEQIKEWGEADEKRIRGEYAFTSGELLGEKISKLLTAIFVEDGDDGDMSIEHLNEAVQSNVIDDYS